MRTPVPPTWQLESDRSGILVRLSGDWLVRTSGLKDAADRQRFLAALGKNARVRFDASELRRWDSALIIFIWDLQKAVAARGCGCELDVSELPEALRRMLVLARVDEGAPSVRQPPAPISLAWRAGDWMLRSGGELGAAADLIGGGLLSVIPAIRRRLPVRPGDLAALMQACGADALGIIAIVVGLVGAILAFVGAVQLQRFGAGIYVADLVGVGVVREMAPIMTAIVMAGRTGGAYAAQIATMQASEEIDALLALGIDPDTYLVLPRILALVAMMPVLYLYACAVGVSGGLFVSTAMRIETPTVFIEQLRSAVLPTEFYIGASKSVCFGAFIAIAGCRTGLRAGRTAAEVGRAATSAVVVGIIGIIAMDAVFAACSNALGI